MNNTLLTSAHQKIIEIVLKWLNIHSQTFGNKINQNLFNKQSVIIDSVKCPQQETWCGCCGGFLLQNFKAILIMNGLKDRVSIKDLYTFNDGHNMRKTIAAIIANLESNQK